MKWTTPDHNFQTDLLTTPMACDCFFTGAGESSEPTDEVLLLCDLCQTRNRDEGPVLDDNICIIIQY